MTLQIFAIYDEKSECFGNPFFMPQLGAAVRAFSDLVSDPNSTVSKHPEDYKLYELGVYDDNSGGFKSLAQPKFLANASDFKNKV